MSDDPLTPHMALDGELDAAHLAAFERELERDPALASRYADLRALSAAIREHAPRETAPERLRAKIEALAKPPARRPLPAWAAMAAGLAGIAALAGYGAGRQTGDPDLAALVGGYQRAALSGQPVDVVSSDRHTVKPWLATRAPLGSRVLDLGAEGYPLLGGRVDVVGGRPVPTLVYRRREHLIAVTELPLSLAATGAATAEGYHVERWRDRERAYAAVSDIDASDLAEFVATFRKGAATE